MVVANKFGGVGMQTGFWMLLAAIAMGVLAAVLEKTWVKTAQICMGLCGLLFMLSVHNAGMRQDIARVWGGEIAGHVLLFLLYGGGTIVAVALYWSLRSLWDDRQKRGKR